MNNKNLQFKILIFFVGLLLFLLSGSVFAEDFYIRNYSVNIDVNKSKQAHITEKIDVVFMKSSHGIYREIPHKDAKIKNISVSERNSIKDNGDVTNIKIGNPNRTVIGEHSYTISYDYNYFDNKNEFYHNIIGTDWNTTIEHVDFSITMPEVFNPEDVGLSIGRYGTRGFHDGAEFRIDGLNISGKVYRSLKPKEGVTVRLQVPEGYFIKTTDNKDKTTKIYVVLLFLLTFISFVIWYKFGKDETAIPVVNFYPPQNMNTLEIELAYKEDASIQGLIAMLISLAQRGYIKINEGDAGDLTTDKSDFTIEKLKSYDGNDSLEQKYMEALFSDTKNSPKDNCKVTKKELKYSTVFYKNCESIIEMANSKRDNLYEKQSVSWSLRFIMMICLLGIVYITYLTIVNFDSYMLESDPGLSKLYIFSLFGILMLVFAEPKSIAIYFPSLLFIVLPMWMIFLDFPHLYNGPMLLSGLACIIISSICVYHLRKRNKKALEILGHLLGFKKFIETADKNRLESLVYEDPQYFYNILPYAYIFGISDKWIKKFESIIHEDPSWYQGSGFNHSSFHMLSSSIMSVSVASQANGGLRHSSGGGGFSGGGGGGGGGGRW